MVPNGSDAAERIFPTSASVKLRCSFLTPSRGMVMSLSKKLPQAELIDDDQEAKQFDLLMLRLQLAILRHEPSYERLRQQVIEIAALLEEKANIPKVEQQLEVIQKVQTDDFCQDVTTTMLENVRMRLRLLVKLIEKGKRIVVYTYFQDTLGDEATIELPGFENRIDFDRFKAKAQQFLRANRDHPAILKLRFNDPLTTSDVEQLEKMLLGPGAGTAAEMDRAGDENYKLGLFFRSLVGLDREAAKRAFTKFLSGKIPTANQIEFINLMIDYLTQRGFMGPSTLYESPFTDISPRGVEGVFEPKEVTQLLSVLTTIREHAAV